MLLLIVFVHAFFHYVYNAERLNQRTEWPMIDGLANNERNK